MTEHLFDQAPAEVLRSNRLMVLAADIRSAHEDIQASAEAMAGRALVAGEQLIEAKAALAHGQWEPWLAEHVGMSARTARRYMQMVRAGMKTATVADLGIRGASEAISRISRKGNDQIEQGSPEPATPAIPRSA